MSEQIITTQIPFQVQPTDTRVINDDGSLNQFIQASPDAAGFDLLAYPEGPMVIEPGECKLVPTGVKLWINIRGIFGAIYPRSGLGVKKGIVLGNGTGIIDSDYQGPLMVPLWNRSDEPFTVNPRDRIAQIVFQGCVYGQTFSKVEEWQETVRAEGGFGSTGVSE